MKQYRAMIDDNVMIGYRAERKIKSRRFSIGLNARVRSGTVIYEGTKIGKHLQTGHNAVIREENEIGDDFCIWNNSVVDYGCRIGSNVKIHSNCYVAQFTTLEDDVFLAPGVTIANDMHPGCEFSKKCMKGPTIKKGTQIGVNVTIAPFVTIGKNCLIGSGSVVTKDMPDNSVAYGNPARVTGKASELKCKTGKNKRGRPYK